MAEGTRAFQIDNIDDLETQISVIPPNLREQYRSLEIYVGKAFVDIYRVSLSPTQIKYLESVHTLYTDYETASQFSEHWDHGINNIDPKISSIGDFVYTGYTVGGNGEESIHESKTLEGGKPRHYWAGRIAIYPLADDEIYPVNIDLLMTQQDFDKRSDTLEISAAFNLIGPYVYSNSVGGDGLHEKIHGIQDPFLPLPIHEAAAYYYQREVGRVKGWDFSLHNNMDQFADLWAECVQEIGSDLHKYIFGNISDKTRKLEILNILKDKFNPQKIEEMSMYNKNTWEDRQRWIYWEKKPVDGFK